MKLLSFDIEDRMKAIGWYQIAGAAIGFYFLIRSIINVGTLTGFTLLLFIISTFLFSFSIYCGNLLRKTNLKGLKLSIWNQALQVLQISVAAVTFSYYSGIRIYFGFNWNDAFMPNAGVSISGLYLSYNTDNPSNLMIFINIVPIAIIYWIGKIERDINERKEIIETVSKLGVESD